MHHDREDKKYECENSCCDWNGHIMDQGIDLTQCQWISSELPNTMST
jgi:hypothetical protein